MFKRHKKIKGIQITAKHFDYRMGGIDREVVYTRGKFELTVDTDVGNRIITEQDLLDYINLKTLE